MIVNGVTLPDIPAEILKQYPYAVIGTQTESDGSTSYVFCASVSEFTFVSKELNTQYGADYLLSKGSTYAISYCGKNGSEWIDVTAEVTETFSACVCPCPIVWSNHDIYTAVFSSGSGFVPGTELYYPACQNFNGVWLPKIPADVLASYPNAIITLAKNNTLGTETYAFWASSTEFIYLSQEVFPEAENTLSSLNDFMSAAYDEDGLAWKDESVIPAGTNLLLAVNAGLTTLDIIWSNHDIYEVASVNEETGEFTYGDIYFANSEEPKPTRVSIGRSLVDGFAKEVQRLTGTTEQMNAIQIREKLSTVKSAIKIGDTVLPPIPEDVLADYPYAVIVKRIEDGLFRLMPSKNVFTHLISGEYETLSDGTTEQKPIYDYDESNGKWVENGTGTGFSLIFGGVLTYEMVWSNFDIKDKTTGEIYFSERQNFNGVWLPKVPADVLAEYPCGVIIHCVETSGEMYGLIVTSNPWKYMSAAVWNPIMGSVLPLPDGSGMLTGFDSELKFTYHCSPTDAVWGSSEEDESNNDLLFPVGVFGRESYIPVWANNDIVEITAVIDADKNEFTYGGLYFPPLPAIDTDRVSIGYDLCDGIVEEVQRLSGESEKMNALHAYWKLTTVIGTTAPSGGIVIDGVTLPEIPADVLASYPYCSILGMNGHYMLIGTQSKQMVGLGTGSGNGGYENDYIRTVEPSGYVMYGYGGEFTDWTLQNQSESFGALELMTPIPFVWANHDLYTWVYSTSENEWVMDEIYFPSSI